MQYKIKEYRLQKGLTMQELADKSGISRVYLGQIENGHVSNIGTKTLVSIAKCLDKKIEDILILP